MTVRNTATGMLAAYTWFAGTGTALAENMHQRMISGPAKFLGND